MNHSDAFTSCYTACPFCTYPSLRRTPRAILNARSLGQLRHQAREQEERARAQQATEPSHAKPEVQLPTPPAT
jgi:hypothetical protein